MFKRGIVWGMDIGDSALKAVKLKRVGKQIAVVDFRIIPYSDLSGVAGERREGYVPQALAALQSAGMKREPCVVSIAPQSVFSRFISLPPVDRRRIPEIVLYEARQQIPFSLNEVIWAYESVRKEFVPGEEVEIGLFAAKREVIESYLLELSPIWRQLHGIQVGPLALYNYVRYEVPIEHSAVILDVGAQSTDLLIIDGNRFWLRNLPVAGNSFTALLEKRLNIPRNEAEKLKYSVAELRNRRKILEVLRPVLRDLVAEVQRSIGYYKSLAQDVKLDEIIVMGEGCKLLGLDRFLEEQLQYRIRSVDKLHKLIYEGDPGRNNELNHAIPSLAPAIGLALQYLGEGDAKINLLPDDFVVRREIRAKRYSGFIAAGLVWAIVGCVYLNQQGALKELDQIATQGEDTLGQYERFKRELDSASQPPDKDRQAAFESFGVNREFDVRVIEAISSVIPSTVVLDGFTFYGKHLGAAVPGITPEGKTELTKEQQAVAESDLQIEFQATSKAVLEKRMLLEVLPAAIAKATVFPENVPLVKGVYVWNVKQLSPEESVRRQEREEDMMVADVVVGLKTAVEAKNEAKGIREAQARAEADAAGKKDEDAANKAETD